MRDRRLGRILRMLDGQRAALLSGHYDIAPMLERVEALLAPLDAEQMAVVRGRLERNLRLIEAARAGLEESRAGSRDAGFAYGPDGRRAALGEPSGLSLRR
ncbi:hypothetical protein [Pontivivens ytuae]|uniref:FlgN protein n=1 Tax=Pontivivens ytuae TaxID=2789856 RepID=A0A7S9QBN5_9RHOB|nr:hypothetical protein [Pontivivens ytuae]QPH53078.1 hypothetical protein I0K15_14900 [Pontivivens ytuae]